MIDSLSSSPTDVTDFAALFPGRGGGVQQQQQGKAAEEDDRSDDESLMIRSISDLLKEIPEALSNQKKRNIIPGSPDDPVSILLR